MSKKPDCLLYSTQRENEKKLMNTNFTRSAIFANPVTYHNCIII